ncbi:MAG: hypothetical protein HC902_03315 [Calothrix sp. SM1_5_4]|nr:hypothetical protein [Calothrix sp. SM1_5_4]
MKNRLHLLMWCAAIGILAYVTLDFWSSRNAPLYRKFERSWRADVNLLEASRKLPAAWFDVKEIELTPGTPETKAWLQRMQIPLQVKKTDGNHKLEILVVAWEEEGKRGALVQYHLVNIESGNTVWGLGRTYVLSHPRKNGLFQEIIEYLRH